MVAGVWPVCEVAHMLLVMHSTNVKVGDVAATYAPIKQTCPTSCPLRDGGGCYAEAGNVGFQVRRLERELDGANGDTLAILEGDEIADKGRHAPQGHPLRIHVSGDASTPFRAAQAARGAASWPGPAWSYTHAWRDVPREAWGRVSVLASVESTDDARKALNRGYAPAILVASHPPNGRSYDEGDVRIVPCPAQTRDRKCTECRLCWDDQRLLATRTAIAFAAHGPGAKRAVRSLTVLR